MKRRILAALVAVTMLAGVCTFASAETEVADPNATPVVEATPEAPKGPIFQDDFEGESTTIETTVGGSAGITVDPKDPTNKVYNISDTTWGQFLSNAFIEGLDKTKEYTMKVDVIGDIGWIGLTETEHWGATYFIAGCNEGHTDDYIIQAPLSELQTWRTAVFKFTGLSVVKLTGQVQAMHGYMGGNLYIDNLVVYEGDMVADLAATPEPTPVVTAAPTAATAAATVTPAPTTSATVAPTSTTKPPKKVTIKFKKKSVKIKKGKKVTLKVTIKNAKKAKFSVDKKGKKVVKLSKKKAKSVVVTGKKKGKATITAKAGKKKATCKVTVK